MTIIRALLLLTTLLASVAQAYPQLHEAARRGDLASVRALLANGADPAERDVNGDTALHEAASQGQLEVVRALLDAGAPVDAANYQDLRPLCKAAVADSPQCCRLLIERGAQVNSRSPGDWTALTATLAWGKSQAAEVLLEAGAWPDLPPDVVGETPLMLASRRGPAAIVQNLLSRGADPRRVDDEGRTALHHAASGDLAQAVPLLLAAGVPLSQADRAGWTALDIALRDGNDATADVLVNAVLASGEDVSRSLPGVCAWGSPQQLCSLLQAGADANAYGADGLPCLALAAGAWLDKQGPRDPQVALAKVKELLRAGALLPEGGTSALMAACRHGNLGLAELLIARGVDPSQSDAHGDYPLLVAVEEGDPAMVERLISSGAEPDVKDPSGRSWSERLELHIAELEAKLDQLNGMRSYHPETWDIERELRALRDQRASLSEMLSR